MDGRERIVEEAFALFSEKGFNAVGIREIGDRAGLTNPALYQHFPSKEALGCEIYRRCYGQLMTAIDQRVDKNMSPLDCLDAYIEAAVSLHRLKPSPLLFLEDEQRRFADEMKSIYGDQTVTSRLTRWVDAGRTTGVIRRDIPTKMLVALIIGQCTKWAAMSSLDLAPKRDAAKWLKALMRSAISAKKQSQPH